jgi:hypothetical protein
MPEYTFHPATMADAEEMAPILRKEDREEVWASHKHTPLEALQYALNFSEECWVARADGKILCMFGIAKMTLLGDTATPWLLGSEEIPKHWRHFLRYGRKVVNAWKERYPVLINFSDSRYITAVRWLRWLGFTIHDAKPFGPYGVPFHQISIGLPDV